MGEQYAEITDESLSESFKRVKQKFGGYDAMKNSFYELRDDISELVKGCANNVKVVIYVNEVLDDPIIVKSGNAENRLRITIKEDGHVSWRWTEETWEKVFREAWSGIRSLLQNIVGRIVSRLRAVEQVKRAAIAN